MCSVQARTQLDIGGEKSTPGAHVKHVLHRCDAGRVETQRLVEHRRALPSTAERRAQPHTTVQART